MACLLTAITDILMTNQCYTSIDFLYFYASGLPLTQLNDKVTAG